MRVLRQFYQLKIWRDMLLHNSSSSLFPSSFFSLFPSPPHPPFSFPSFLSPLGWRWRGGGGGGAASLWSHQEDGSYFLFSVLSLSLSHRREEGLREISRERERRKEGGRNPFHISPLLLLLLPPPPLPPQWVPFSASFFEDRRCSISVSTFDGLAKKKK